MNIPNGSITPPCSPPPLDVQPCDVEERFDPISRSFQDLCAGSPVICFMCEGAALHGDTHPNSYLRQGTLQKLRNGSVIYPGDITVPIFGENIMHDGLDRLFCLAKKLISVSEMASLVRKPETHQENEEIIKFFNYLKTYVYRCVTVETAPILMPRLLNHLKGLLLHIQRLTDLPSHVVGSAASSKQSCSRQVFHLHLDMHWALLELLHIITVQFPDVTRDSACVWCHYTNTEDVVNNDVFSQCVHMFLWDVIALAMKTHSLIAPQQFWQLTPYPCGCVKEMLIMLKQLIDTHRQETMGRQSFWGEMSSLFASVLQPAQNSSDMDEMDSDVFCVPPSYTCQDPLDFSWWFLMNIAPLYAYDEHGISQKKQLVTSNYPLMTQLLKKSLTLRESQQRRHLRCCLRVSALWEGSIVTLNMLWDYFYKCLNDQFHLTGSGVVGVASVSKTSASLLEKCQSLVQAGNYGTDYDTSFQLFLRLLAMHLGKSTSGNSTLWKQMKGRFYSRFHSRRMQELSETGLNHLTTLFLSLTYSVSLQDVGSKLFDFYHMLDMKVIDVHRHRAIWRGSFALMLRFLEKELDIGFMAEKMVQDFNWLCAELRQSGEGPSPNYELVMFYVDSLQDIIEASTLYLHQHQLLGTGLRDLLHCCRVSELSVLMNLVDVLLIQHRVAYKRAPLGHEKMQTVDNNSVLLYCRELAGVLWQHFYQFVRVHSCTLTPPPLLADLAAGFTLLLVDSPPSGQTGVRETLKECFLHFGCSEQVNAMVSCRYLCHMMPNKDVMSRLAVALTNHESRLIQAWFQCSCLLPSDTSMLQELTRLILKLESVQSIFSRADIDTTNSCDVIVCLFIQALGAIYSKLTDLKSKIELRCEMERYLQGMPGCVSIVLKTASTSLHQNIYLLAGWLTRHCATSLYIQSKPDCLLPILLDRLVLPRILLTPSKPVPPHMLSALQKTLYLFVQGLGDLDYKRDPYIQRRLKDVILLYLPRFPLSSSGGQSVSAVHPLLTSLSDSCRVVPLPEAVSLRHYVLHVLSLDCLSPRGMILPPNAHLAMTFVVELFNKTMSRAVLARDCAVLLSVVLQYMLCCENASLKQSCARVLQMMLEAVRDHPEATDRAALQEVLKVFLGLMKTCHGRVLRVMESVSILCPSVVIDVIPTMTQAVKTSESMRGVGVDKELRCIPL
ncbi:Protein MMS22-like [Lamellibrachia satsuma]|nr:Protein MMS22-like [Lamellibrachia satsuma]